MAEQPPKTKMHLPREGACVGGARWGGAQGPPPWQRVACMQRAAPADGLCRVPEERARREAAGGRLDPRHGGRVEHVHVLQHEARVGAGEDVELGADDDRGVADARGRRRAVDVRLGPREERRVEHVRVAHIAEAHAVAAEVVDLGRAHSAA